MKHNENCASFYNCKMILLLVTIIIKLYRICPHSCVCLSTKQKRKNVWMKSTKSSYKNTPLFKLKYYF